MTDCRNCQRIRERLRQAEKERDDIAQVAAKMQDVIEQVASDTEEDRQKIAQEFLEAQAVAYGFHSHYRRTA